jgi:hypothetical protein
MTACAIMQACAEGTAIARTSLDSRGRRGLGADGAGLAGRGRPFLPLRSPCPEPVPNSRESSRRQRALHPQRGLQGPRPRASPFPCRDSGPGITASPPVTPPRPHPSGTRPVLVPSRPCSHARARASPLSPRPWQPQPWRPRPWQPQPGHPSPCQSQSQSQSLSTPSALHRPSRGPGFRAAPPCRQRP